MALLDNSDMQINTIMLGFAENHSLDVEPLSDLCWQMSHLHRPGKCTYPTDGIHHHTGSSQWSPGLCDEDQIALVMPGFVQLCGLGPCDPGNPHHKPHQEHDKGEIDRCPSDAMGKHLDWPISWQFDNELPPLRKMTKLPLKSQTLLNMMK